MSVCIAVFITNSTVVDAKENVQRKRVVSKESYEKKVMDTDVLFEKAEEGEIVNDEFTQVDVSYQNL